MKRITSIFLVLGFVLGFAQLGFAKVTLTAVTMYNEVNYQHQGLLLMAKRMAELTNGEVEIKVVVGPTLGFKGPDLLRAAGDGQIDMIEIVASNVAGDAPVLGLRTLPMLIENWDEIVTFDKMAAPYYQAALDRFNQELLVISPWPFGGLWATKKVESVEQMKGMKIRAYDRNGTLFAAAVGASGINVPFAETYQSLSTGLLDSVITSAISVREGKFFEVCNFHMPIRFASATSITTINKKSLAKLTPDQQKLLKQVSEEAAAFLTPEVKKVVAENDAYCYANGVTMVPVSPEFHAGLVEAGKKVAIQWLEQNKKATDAVELYNKFMATKK